MKRSEISAGSELRDNDKRQNGRIVQVLDVLDAAGTSVVDAAGDAEVVSVVYYTGKRTATISTARIFTDGKKRQRGFNLIPPVAVTADAQYEAPVTDPA